MNDVAKSVMRIPFSVNASMADAIGGHTRFSVPLPRGIWQEPVAVRIRDDSDSCQVPQCWPLARWPDHSVRVLHGIARLKGGDYVMEIGGEAPGMEELNGSLSVATNERGGIIVDNGRERAVFSPDALLQEAKLDGVVMFDQHSMAIRVVDCDGPAFATEMEKERPPRLLQAGPLYAKIELWARASCQRSARYLRFRLQFEFFAGTSGFACAVMVVNDCPGEDFQHFRAIDVTFRIADAQQPRQAVFQKSSGFEGIYGRFAESDQKIEVRLDERRFSPCVADAASLSDNQTYPHYLKPPLTEVENLVFIRDGQRLCQVEVEDFHLLRPKDIRLESGSATCGLWPAWAEPVEWQQGRRRQVRFAVAFGNAGLPKTLAEAQQASAALLDVHRCQFPSEVYAGKDFFDQGRGLPFRPDLYPRFEGWLSAASQLRTPASFFDLGDTPDTHYLRNYIPVGASARRRGEGWPRIDTVSGRDGQCNGSLGDFETIWVNNEYDVLFCLGSEHLRSSNSLLYQQLRWFARHTIEVDNLCYSDHEIHHRAQPAHSEKHTTTGAYPSHFWTQGLAQYYFLSGDEDALEVIRWLADKTIWYFEHPVLGKLNRGINREMGWAVLTLVSAYEADGNESYLRYATQLIDEAMDEPLPNDLPVFSFGHTSLLLGCRAWLQAQPCAANGERVRKWFLSLVSLAVRSSQGPPGGNCPDIAAPKLSYDFELMEKGRAVRQQPRSGMLPGFFALDCLAFAYELTGSVEWLHAGLRTLEAFMDGNPGCFEYILDFRRPLPEGKPFAVGYRTFINYLGALHQAGMLSKFDYKSPHVYREQS